MDVILVAAGAVVLAVAIGFHIANLHVQTVLSGSMRPTTSPGNLAMTQGVPTGSLRVSESSSSPRLTAMIGTSRVMMGGALREPEADGLVKREHGGGIRIMDADRLAQLATVASPDGAPAL